MTLHPHIIQKSSIDLQFYGRVDGIALQKEVELWYQLEFMPLLDKVLQPFAVIKDHIRMDRIEISVDTGSTGNWKEKLAQDVILQIQEKLEALHKGMAGSNASWKSEEQSFTELLVFYLENGHLPWWSRIKNKADLLDQWGLWLKGDVQDMEPVKTALKKDVARIRVLHLLPADLFNAFTIQLNPVYKDVLPSLWHEVDQLTAGYPADERKKVEDAFRSGLLQNIAMNTTHTFQVVAHDLLQNLASNNSSSSDQKAGGSFNNESIFINNAGLVIVAPFLPILFARLHLAEEGKMAQPATAVKLLYYLVTGADDAAEFELVLPKILCGIEISEVIDTDVILTVEQKTEADNLLSSAIEHWNILKNTSIDGLREAFLQREGKLSFQNDTWLLQVEQKPYDMLLQQIPWNINMLKLSWMNYMLRTEWT